MASAKQREFIFTVMGRRPFPVDMLRYDACWPRGPEDVSQLETVLNRRVPTRNAEGAYVQITFRSWLHRPTEGRWASFGWRVIDNWDQPHPRP